MKTTITNALLLGVSLACLTFQAQAQDKSHIASPLQTGHYSPGIISIRDFADPAPVSGLVFLDYNVFLSGDKYYDASGKEVTQVSGPLGQPITLEPDVSGYINNPVLMYVSKGKLLGATYIAGISVPYMTVNVNAAYARIGIVDSLHQDGSAGGGVSGFSDLNVMPLYLSWGLEKFDITAGYMFFAPTGKYVTGGSDNTGLGYWSNVFQVFAYYYPMKVDGKASKATAIMFAPTYEIIGKIKDVDVIPGNRLDLDYGIDQYFTDELSVGVFGGNAWQVGDDTGKAVYWNGTVKDQNGIVGAQVGYWLWKNRFQAIAKYGHTYGNQEHFGQNYFQVNLTYVANALTGNKASKKPSGK